MDAAVVADVIKARLRGAEADWPQLLAGMYRHALAQPVESVVERERVRGVMHAHVDANRLQALARAAFALFIRPAVAESRAANVKPVSRWMPESAQNQLVELAAEKGLISDAWVKELFAQKAAEELLADTLYQALKDFSTLVPLILQKVLPKGLGRLAGFAANAGQKMFDEVERILDGEIKRFLEKGTRKALGRAAAFAADNMDGPTASDSRRNIVRFALRQTAEFHVESLTDARLETLEEIVLATADHLAGLEEAREIVDRQIDALWAAHAKGTLGDSMAAVGLDVEPPLDAWAALTWPVLQQAVEAPPVQAWIDALAADIAAASSGS